MPKPRRVLPWSEDRSTDKIYRSDNVSAISPNLVDIKRKKNAAKQPGKAKRRDERSTDQYYRAAEKQETTPRKTTQAADWPLVASKEELHAALKDVIIALKNGWSPIVIRATPTMLPLVRTAIDLMVTGGRITEDQYRDIHLVAGKPLREKATKASTMKPVVSASEPDGQALPVAEIDLVPKRTFEIEAAPPVRPATTIGRAGQPETLGTTQEQTAPEPDDDNDFLPAPVLGHRRKPSS